MQSGSNLEGRWWIFGLGQREIQVPMQMHYDLTAANNARLRSFGPGIGCAVGEGNGRRGRHTR